jgi:predicted nucleic acid-binding protein
VVEEAEVVSISDQIAGNAAQSEDDLVLAIALAGEADYIVIGDHARQMVGSHRGVVILSPQAMIRVLEAGADVGG